MFGGADLLSHSYSQCMGVCVWGFHTVVLIAFILFIFLAPNDAFKDLFVSYLAQKLISILRFLIDK